jgi:hypothetical protein
LCLIDCPLFIDLWMIFFFPDFPDFQSFIYLDKDSFGGGIYPETSWDLNCTSKGFSCIFLDLTVNQVLKVYPVISLINVLNQSMQVLT